MMTFEEIPISYKIINNHAYTHVDNNNVVVGRQIDFSQTIYTS